MAYAANIDFVQGNAIHLYAYIYINTAVVWNALHCETKCLPGEGIYICVFIHLPVSLYISVFIYLFTT